MRTCDIQIRDPFILPVAASQTYYLFGTTDRNCWGGAGTGFDCYRSHDLEEWDGPVPAFRPPAGFWATTNFWAPEAHAYRGRYYLFASFKAPQRYRGTQILVADRPEGPYVPHSPAPVTPADWECLDGTLHVAADGAPWIVFCHEWVQVHNGAMVAQQLAPDLTCPIGRPVQLFSASEAPWVNRPPWPAADANVRFPTYVTDGPFLFQTRTGVLLMLWSSCGAQGYTMGIAHSESGTVVGPWAQQAEPLWVKDGGHGMIFRAFDGRLFVTLHMPNQTPHERPHFAEIADCGDTVRVKQEQE